MASAPIVEEEDKKAKKKLSTFEPTIGDISFKKRFWGCLICKSLKNDVKINRCGFCGTMRPADRFALIINGIGYLCRVHSEKSFPIVTILRISCEGEIYEQNTRLPLVSENIEECVRAAIASLDTENRTGPITQVSIREEKMDRDLGDEDLTLDLFDRVMKTGGSYAYDGNIGQFIHIDTLSSRDDDSLIHTDLNYLKLMKREKMEMGKIVQAKIDQRSAEQYANAFDSTVDKLHEWKGKQSCSLCELQFPVAQLLGTISFKAITKWKEERNVPVRQDAKVKAENVYDTAKLCLFCTQFFDASYADVFDVEKEANDDCKKRTKQFVQMVKNKESPLVGIQIGLAIAELKQKKNSGGMKIMREAETEVHKLEVERRKLNYLLAQQKFQKHAKILKLEKQLEDSMDALQTNGFVNGSTDRQRRRGVSTGALPEPDLRSQSSDGNIGRPKKNGSLLGVGNNDEELSSMGRSKTSEGLKATSRSSSKSNSNPATSKGLSKKKSASSLPMIEQSSLARQQGRSNLESVNERIVNKQAIGQKMPVSRRPVDRAVGDSTGSHSGAGKGKTTPAKEEPKLGKPEWVEVHSGVGVDCSKRISRTHSNSQTTDEVPITAVQLVESATKVYAKKKTSKSKVNSGFSRRRRDVNDPRNSVKPPARGTGRVSTLGHRGRSLSVGSRGRRDRSMSVGSTGSTRSVGSTRSRQSVGSTGSTRSVGSTRSRQSVGSTGSTRSVGSTRSRQSVGSTRSRRSVGNSVRNIKNSSGKANGPRHVRSRKTSPRHDSNPAHAVLGEGVIDTGLHTISEVAFTSPQKAEIIAAHKAPNLKEAKKLKIRVKNTLVEPSVAISKRIEIVEAKRAESTECELKSTISPSSVKHVSTILIKSLDEDDDNADNASEENYCDDFDPDVEMDGGSLEGTDRKSRNAPSSEVCFTSSDFFGHMSVSEQSSTINVHSASPNRRVDYAAAASEQSAMVNRHVHEVLKGYHNAEDDSSSLSLSPVRQGHLNVIRPNGSSRLLSRGLTRTSSTGHLTTGVSTPNGRTRSEACYDIPCSPGIELLSGRPMSSRKGSRGGRRPTSSTLLPFYENTDPLVLNPAPKSPGSNWGGMFAGSGVNMEDVLTPSSVSTGSALGSRRASRGVNRLEKIVDSEDRSSMAHDSAQSKYKTTRDTEVEVNISEEKDHADDVKAAKLAVSIITGGVRQRKVSLPSNLLLRQSIGISQSKSEAADDVKFTDSKQDQKASNSTASLRRATTKASDIVKALAGCSDSQSMGPTALDMNILKKTGAVRKTMKKEDSFEKFTREMEVRKKRAPMNRQGSSPLG